MIILVVGGFKTLICEVTGYRKAKAKLQFGGEPIVVRNTEMNIMIGCFFRFVVFIVLFG